MTLKIISDDKLLMALLPGQPESQRASTVTPGQRRVAQAQLEADQKEYDKLLKAYGTTYCD